MIVIDASAVVELIHNDKGLQEQIRAEILHDPQIITPEHTLLEVAQTFRRFWLVGEFGLEHFQAAISRLAELDFETWPTKLLLSRIIELSPNATTYDAAYLALSEELGAKLITLDQKMAKVPGSAAWVQVIGDQPD